MKKKPINQVEHHSRKERHYQGIASAPGILEGRIVIYMAVEQNIPLRTIDGREIASEMERFEKALLATQQELLEIKKHVFPALNAHEATLFDAHLLVLEDPALLKEVLQLLHRERLNVEHVFDIVIKRFCESLNKRDSAYLRERILDIKDVSRRILNHLLGKPTLQPIDQNDPVIIVATTLTLSDAVMVYGNRQAAFATENGSQTSHTAILARAFGIPAVVGLRHVISELKDGEPALLDGYHGLLIVNPTKETIRGYQRMQLEQRDLDKDLEKIRDLPAVTQDGQRITLSANLELPRELESIFMSGAEGIGLYRTEFLYLNRATPPEEEEQYQVLCAIAQRCYPYHAIIRTFDIGADKPTYCLPPIKEANPFLGCRGVRFALQHKELFKAQLRVILRAATMGNLRMMYPMISGIDELREANGILEEVKKELRDKKIPFQEDLEVGMMIEVPSAALIADLLAREVKFFSIGTNDLVQYLTSVDRGNESISHLYNPAHPGVIRMLKMIVDAAHAAGISVGVCGEIAGDLLFTPLLVGLGVDELSTSAMLIPRIKKAIQSLNVSACQELVAELLNGESATKNYARCVALAQNQYGTLLSIGKGTPH
ncbi:MAG: phosphoenolpyruvate--protein phosphotransferase [Verrucomicrobia bacterium]|nr:MAG: phosphoenolpyruvate--protein phosphotransferase [Verrucomicrobiota bacterium]